MELAALRYLLTLLTCVCLFHQQVHAGVFRETCYYTRSRAARLGTVAKRMYSGTPVVTECEYPGVVGLYREPDGPKEAFQCMGTLLEEDTILITDYCLQLIKSNLSQPVHALVESYQQSNVSPLSPTVVTSSAKLLDPTGANKKFYTISLSSPVAFNDQCVQPACVPNANIRSNEIDLADCRIVGYGDNTDGKTGPCLVSLTLITGPCLVSLTLRTGPCLVSLTLRTGPCLRDQGAPLICNHMITGEWITIGVVTSVGFACSRGTLTSAAVTSLLRETSAHALYNGLQYFKYALL
ncbi:unnamed protein product [Lymnaea stagnalis]|uniref:Peptidase S1 domain-containing protein n=1 Tax=Lymnaea stagnalis TaxID=6523 RepID=A0AAV2HXW6_LYMST